ncbi:MAG: hypothetical protein MUF72_21290 [Elainella sp. Prado103]|nr:hypothetical protein [Elainella sp. Prado103]
MSLIHLEKSVLTFHLKEIIEDGQSSHPLTWLGLSLLIFAPKLFSRSPMPTKPQPLSSGFTPVSLSQWIAEAKKRELDSPMYSSIEIHALPQAEQARSR